MAAPVTSHVRWNPLRGEWILVCPHRTQRPWMGRTEKLDVKEGPDRDPSNPLCPGSLRNGVRNPQYQSTYAFDNDFPALRENDESSEIPDGSLDLFQCAPVSGKCRVICFHPNMNVSLPLMEISEIEKVIETWQEEQKALGQKFMWVQIFENKGDLMGCSNPHPHCQVWASSFLPNEARIEDERQKEYHMRKGHPLLSDYVLQEMQKSKNDADNRIVVQNDDWIVMVPFWACWPFETILISKSVKIKRLTDLNDQNKKSLAEIIKILTIKYDNLFETSFPYSMGFHGAPTGPKNDEDNNHWMLHAHYYPPLLRSSTIRKFMVGYELLAQAQRDLTPENAARRLRETCNTHYTRIP